MKKLAIILTHPVQYYSPLFQLLAKRGNINPKVFYTWSQAKFKVADKDFGQNIQWDIPLLDGYEHTFIQNVAPKPGSHHFWGIVNPSLIEEITKWGPEAIMVHGWNFHSHLKIMRHFKGKIPVLFRGDSTLLDPRPRWKSALRKVCLRWVYRHIDFALFVGHYNYEYYITFGLQDNQLVYAPHAIDNQRFLQEDEIKEGKAKIWKKELGIPEKNTVFLFAGKLYDVKAPERLLENFKQLQNPNTSLIFIGEGALRPHLENNARGLKNVYFTGFINQEKMPVAYKLGDFFILPSLSETWGLSVNEAMACGRPVIISDRVGCAPDLVKDGETGYVFSTKDPGSIIQTLEKAIDKRDFFEKQRSTIQQWINRWSFEQICKSIESILA